MPNDNEKSATQQRIENAVYGTPKVKPDEQRKYLGTFRERVCLTISVQELREQDWQAALAAELKRGIGNLVFLNGNLPHEEIHPYLLTTSQNGGIFTLKTDPEYKTDPASLAVVVAAKKGVYQTPVDVKKRYPQLLAQKPAAPNSAAPQKESLLHRLLHRKDHD